MPTRSPALQEPSFYLNFKYNIIDLLAAQDKYRQTKADLDKLQSISFKSIEKQLNYLVAMDLKAGSCITSFERNKLHVEKSELLLKEHRLKDNLQLTIYDVSNKLKIIYGWFTEIISEYSLGFFDKEKLINNYLKSYKKVLDEKIENQDEIYHQKPYHQLLLTIKFNVKNEKPNTSTSKKARA